MVPRRITISPKALLRVEKKAKALKEASPLIRKPEVQE
jgi:hypothetical protein